MSSQKVVMHGMYCGGEKQWLTIVASVAPFLNRGEGPYFHRLIGW